MTKPVKAIVVANSVVLQKAVKTILDAAEASSRYVKVSFDDIIMAEYEETDAKRRARIVLATGLAIEAEVYNEGDGYLYIDMMANTSCDCICS